MFRTVIYSVAFVTGAIVMSFEMLGSRYLNPYFGSGIYTWAAIISTVLAALASGYFLGGFIADRTVSAAVLGAIVALGSAYLLALPSFAETILGFVADAVDNIRLGSLYSALAIMFVPVMLLGIYSPFAIRLMLRNAQDSGIVSGAVYGVSTAGSIAGTLGTTFFLIPLIGTRAITLSLGTAGVVCGLYLIVLDRSHSYRKTAKTGLVALAVLFGNHAWSEDLFDANVRARMLKLDDGRVAHIETEYNSLYINKRGPFLSLTTRVRNEINFHSIVDLADPDGMPVPYTQIVSAALLYPETMHRILMVGLGAGSISTYFGRAMPEVRIDVVELDPAVIAIGREYFGLQETDRVRFIASDGRVYLNRNKDLYDLIILDAYRELGIPFHMLTREFYALVKQHLALGGAVASNISGNTKLYLSSLATLRAVFPTIDVYPDRQAYEAQAIVVAVPTPRPSAATLMQRATVLQERYHFRYPLSYFVDKRVENQSAEGSDVLTDDFAPVNLYEAIPLWRRNR